MTRSEYERVRLVIDIEGFSYCFENYDTFEEIDDEVFHGLRKQYLYGREMLELYLESEKSRLSL